MANWIDFVIQGIYLMLPAYFANMAPVLVRGWFKSLARPVDSDMKFNGQPILGNHKTVRGIVFAILFGVAIAGIQRLVLRYDFFSNISIYSYDNWLLWGFLLGFGAIFGDLLKSFVKRRFNIKPGARFIPWDQVDFVVVSILFGMLIYRPTFTIIITIIITSFVLDVAINHLAFYLKLRNEKW